MQLLCQCSREWVHTSSACKELLHDVLNLPFCSRLHTLHVGSQAIPVAYDHNSMSSSADKGLLALGCCQCCCCEAPSQACRGYAGMTCMLCSEN